MTGSGKTGLCICLLEEAALDGVPSIIIDPKGDITNLMLTFPRLGKDDFLPWVNDEDAARKGLSVDDYASKQADQWKAGLAEWGEDGARIQRLRDSAQFTIYTPGSSAGIPISVLKSFEVPPKPIMEDEELLQERINTTVTSLLGLLGIDADPVKSREYILLSTIISAKWRSGSGIDLAGLISNVQKPPVQRIGVLELETFYPSKERFSLAMQLNNLLASPGFQLWQSGAPMDAGAFLHDPNGKPKVSIFYIAHLSDAERMFFVPLLLDNLVGWMRTQSGTTSLRGILYIDEVFGYMPPTANPPSKLPLMTLLKQARAFGIGVVLATQNPVDLDYKGLSNAGTWLIGRLQTDRDKLRILDALEGVAAASGSQLGRDAYDRIITNLGNRVFLMHNVHETTPVVFETRWSMSYLRGPLTREQIKTLMDSARPAVPLQATPTAIPSNARSPESTLGGALQGGGMPILPPDIPQYFLPAAGTDERNLVYRPMLLGIAQVRFADAKNSIDTVKDLSLFTPITSDPVPVDWSNAKEITPPPNLESSPAGNSSFTALPMAATNPKNYAAWQKGFADWLMGNQRLELMKSPSLGQISKVGESESEFRIRMQQISREKRDGEVEKIRQKYAPKMATLDNRIRTAQMAVEREQLQSKDQKLQTAVSIGTTLLGAFLGSRGVSGARTTARDLGRSAKQGEDVKASEENLATLQKQRADLDAEFQSDISAMDEKHDSLTEPLEKVSLSPKKGDISIRLCTLAWTPNPL